MTVDKRLVLVVVTAVVVALPVGARAQAPQAPAARAAATQAQPPAPPVTSGWQDAFLVQSSDGAYRLQLGLVAQLDGRYVVDDSNAAAINTFTVRKLRPAFLGRVARYFDFQVVPDFGGGAAVLQDGFVDVRFSNAFRVRMGKSKTPIGYEVLISDPYVLFPERSLVSSLIPNRDVGFQVLGDLPGGKVSYAGGVYNGIPDGSSSTADVDTNGSKDLAGRIVLQPFRASTPGALNGLGFALGGSVGPQVGALPSFRTSVGRRYFSYAPGVTASGTRTRIQPTIFYYYKALGAFAEFAQSTQEITRDELETDVSNHAWEVTASFVLTGEAATDRGVRPTSNFDPVEGHWGALELIARYATLEIDDAAFAAGLATASSAGEAQQLSVGANWYPSAFIKYYAAFERTSFSGASAPVPEENSLIIRAQVGF